MIRLILFATLVIAIAGCDRVQNTRRPPSLAAEPGVVVDAGPLDACVSDVQPVLTRDAGPPTKPPPPDPCDLHAEDIAYTDAVTPRHPAPPPPFPPNTRLELLAVGTLGAGTRVRPAVTARVRVRDTGQESWVMLNALAVGLCQASQRANASVYESHIVRVHGVDEEWRLRILSRFAHSPADEDDIDWQARYERRFEPVDLVLERRRGRTLLETVHQFPNEWPGNPIGFRAPMSPWPGIVRPSVLDIGDYNHDGEATEFPLDTGFIVCFKSGSGVFGLTPRLRRLHPLVDIDGEDMRISQERTYWETVRTRQRGRFLTWSCGNHGSTDDQYYQWRVTRRGFDSQIISIERGENCGFTPPRDARATPASDAAPDPALALEGD